ncbi:MAG TPA: hypothetical protein PKD63_08635 [Solirubrobacteraceae bacterium]|nr:hypothetical protein [Solirubrobacteraceae bacterium]
MRRVIPALLIAVIAAFTVAACGGSDDATPPTKAEYKTEYTALVKELYAVGAAVGEAVGKAAGKSNKELEKSFSSVADKTRAIADKFDDTTPPDDPTIKAQQAKLVAGLNVSADDLEAISKAAAKNDLKAAGAAAAKLTQDNAGVSGPKAALDKALGIKPPAPPAKTTKTTTTTGK